MRGCCHVECMLVVTLSDGMGIFKLEGLQARQEALQRTQDYSHRKDSDALTLSSFIIVSLWVCHSQCSSFVAGDVHTPKATQVPCGRKTGRTHHRTLRWSTFSSLYTVLSAFTLSFRNSERSLGTHIFHGTSLSFELRFKHCWQTVFFNGLLCHHFIIQSKSPLSWINLPFFFFLSRKCSVRPHEKSLLYQGTSVSHENFLSCNSTFVYVDGVCVK